MGPTGVLEATASAAWEVEPVVASGNSCVVLAVISSCAVVDVEMRPVEDVRPNDPRPVSLRDELLVPEETLTLKFSTCSTNRSIVNCDFPNRVSFWFFKMIS